MRIQANSQLTTHHSKDPLTEAVTSAELSDYQILRAPAAYLGEGVSSPIVIITRYYLVPSFLKPSNTSDVIYLCHDLKRPDSIGQCSVKLHICSSPPYKPSWTQDAVYSGSTGLSLGRASELSSYWVRTRQ